MKEGLLIWDASKNKLFISKIFVLLGLADGPGLTYLNGLTGHSGAFGCRLYCPVKGRRKDGGNHYYPALVIPKSRPEPSSRAQPGPRSPSPAGTFVKPLMGPAWAWAWA
ncbi:hypothetical protein B0H34DRAFT_657539 [Crassisporium funariophilum]|nr:hypothetical protein B0H34DRAFT_657539 [Crassisporium funariophilum]